MKGGKSWYTVPENLFNDASEMLRTMSHPVRAYECSVVDLAKQNPDYTFLAFSMHKKITLIDIERSIRVEHQIVEYDEYPDEPERNVVTLSCIPETIQSGMNSIKSQSEQAAEKVKTTLDSRIMMATAMLTGFFGGHVYNNEDEILLLDTDDPATAQIVWRWNINGFGKSSTGIDGPYTSALTFDDTFITNVIHAMIIRGSLIEGESITAEAISQSYTDDVLDESYTAAKGLVSAEFKKVAEYLTGNEELDDGTAVLDVLRTSLTSIQESVNGLQATFRDAYSGGINYVQNSSGLNGVSDDWEFTGNVSALQNDDTKNTTVANSCFRLAGSSSLSQTINSIVPGISYYFGLKAKKTGNLFASIKLVYNGDREASLFASQEASDWTEYSIILTDVQSTNIEIVAESSGDYLYIADIMLCEGEIAKGWTPAPNEIYTSGAKIDKNGIEVFREGSTEKTVINNHEFAGYYNDEKIFTVNKDETQMKKTVVDGEFTVGDCKFIPFSSGSESGLNIALID